MGFTQKKAAKLLKQSFRGYQDWEYGKSQITPLVADVCVVIENPSMAFHLWPR